MHRIFQSDVCASALSEVIPAVLEGSDGCLLAMGYPATGQAQTVLGELGGGSGSGSASGSGVACSLGAAPCAIAWLYKGIQERRQKSGARFSVRVSAVGVSATKPDALSQDLLISHAAGKHMADRRGVWPGSGVHSSTFPGQLLNVPLFIIS